MLPLGEVVLGTDDDARYRTHATEVYNLVVDYLDHVEGLSRRDGIYENEAVDSDGVFRIEDRVLILCDEKGLARCARQKEERKGDGGVVGLLELT